MRKFVLLSALLLALAAALCLTGCSKRGVPANAAINVVELLVKAHLEGEDYSYLCDESLTKERAEPYLDKIVNTEGYYQITYDGSLVYEEINGKRPRVTKTRFCIGMFSGRHGDCPPSHGYAIVLYNPKTQLYRVRDVYMENSDGSSTP